MKFTIMLQAGDHTPALPRPGTVLMVPRYDIGVDIGVDNNNIVGTLINYEDAEELAVPTGYTINDIDIGWCFVHKDTLDMKGFSLFLVTIFMI